MRGGTIGLECESVCVRKGKERERREKRGRMMNKNPRQQKTHRICTTHNTLPTLTPTPHRSPFLFCKPPPPPHTQTRHHNHNHLQPAVAVAAVLLFASHPTHPFPTPPHFPSPKVSFLADPAPGRNSIVFHSVSPPTTSPPPSSLPSAVCRSSFVRQPCSRLP